MEQSTGEGRRFLPDPQVCERYGVSDMTLYRWDHDPATNFPKPYRFGKRFKYRALDELEAWERARAAQPPKARPNAERDSTQAA